MKTTLKTVVLMAAAALWFAGCKKDETKNFFLGGKNPALTASKTNVVLTPATEKDEAIRFNWTNPEYQFSTGMSSHNVQYALEIDVNQQFNSPSKYVTTISNETVKAYTVFDFNVILGNNMLLPLDVPVTVYARIVSSLRFESSVNAQLASNIVTIQTKPYAPPPLVPLPAAGNLWATGNAFPSDWANPLPPPYDTQQKFTKVTNTLYEGVFTFKGGGNYKLIQEQGVWGSQYHMITGGTASAGSFEMADAEPGFIGPTAAGQYKVSFNFQTGKFTVTPQ